ncbi:MAG: ArsR family transcriptional regulator [Gammaproteobacteria bacterium]|nr:ArsR family transcriptional regulator [Gammaproteobacteria bacterium]
MFHAGVNYCCRSPDIMSATMFGKFPISEVASLLSDPARVAMLTALLNGEARPAGELARIAGLSPQAASAHLAKLTAARLLTKAREGRHHYYRMARPEVGLALEALAVVSPAAGHAMPTDSDANRELRFARTCYDHLVGRFAVQLADALVRKQLLSMGSREFRVTPNGELFLESLGIHVAALREHRRAFARACIDWTERKYHLAGSVGAELLCALCAKGWVARQKATRAVRLTGSGRKELGKLLDLRFD